MAKHTRKYKVRYFALRAQTAARLAQSPRFFFFYLTLPPSSWCVPAHCAHCAASLSHPASIKSPTPPGSDQVAASLSQQAAACLDCSLRPSCPPPPPAPPLLPLPPLHNASCVADVTHWLQVATWQLGDARWQSTAVIDTLKGHFKIFSSVHATPENTPHHLTLLN